MYIIVGLGNPGTRYHLTRHNVGFMVLDRFIDRFQFAFTRQNGLFEYRQVELNGKTVLLVKPLTYMNLSGRAVEQLVAGTEVKSYSRLLVVCDDFNLPFGTVRLRTGGSAGGQKGLESILKTLQTNEVPRLRIGIGNEFHDPVDHVLSPFQEEELKQLPLILEWACNAVEAFITRGISYTMSRFNRHVLENE